MNAPGVMSGQRAWRTGLGPMLLDRPRVMGIVNVTPDSFWAGSRSPTSEDAVRRAESMLEAGADLLDVGGESTRPGARPVPSALELERVLPVVRELVRRHPHVPVSVDTVKAEVADAVRLINSRRYAIEKIATHVFPLEKAEAGMKLFMSGDPECIRVALKP